MSQGLQARIRSQSTIVKPAQRIALFGGTFDPVHAGHWHIAQLAREQVALDQVIFLPCQQSPHKTQSCDATMSDRLAMLRLATAHDPAMQVSDYEATAPIPSYSYRTVEHFIEQNPSAEWFWLMGGDQWLALPRWKHPEILAQHLTFLVFSRGQIPQAREGYRMQHLLGDHPASATALREPQSGHYQQQDWLHPDVKNYIEQKQLYR